MRQNVRIPPPPPEWSSAAKDAWNQLSAALQPILREGTSARRTVRFEIQGVVSSPVAPVTVNTTSGTLAELYRVVAYIIAELDRQNILSRK